MEEWLLCKYKTMETTTGYKYQSMVVQDLVRLSLVIGLDQDTMIFLLPEKGYRMENTTKY